MDSAGDPRSGRLDVVQFHHPGYHFTVALNIKDPETEALADEVAKLTGDSKTGALRTVALTAFERFGKGRHPAALNFGDDFARTDLEIIRP